MTFTSWYLHWKVYHALAHYSDLASYFSVNKNEHIKPNNCAVCYCSECSAADSYPLFSFLSLRLLLPVNCLG